MSTRGLRGSVFEELLNLTNEQYKSKKLALIQKIPTSIVPTQFDTVNKVITRAHFEKKSTVDYIGVIQSIPVCFEVKMTTTNSLPLKNIHEHQIEFMKNFREQGGVSFLLVQFSELDKHFLLPLEIVEKFTEKNNGRRSIPLSEFENKYFFERSGSFFLHYLPVFAKYVEWLDRRAS